MTDDPKSPKYDFRNAQFGGGFAEKVAGDQVGSITNNYGFASNELIPLIASLRDQSQLLPVEHRSEIIEVIDGLDDCAQKANPDRDQIIEKLKRLGVITAAIASITASGSTAIKNVEAFSEGILQIAEKVDISVEQIMPNHRLPPKNF